MGIEDTIARLRGELDNAYDAADASLEDGSELALQMGRFTVLEIRVRKLQKVLFDKASREGTQPHDRRPVELVEKMERRP